MKAVRIHKHGGLDVLQIDDIPMPKIKPNQCLIHIKAAALNHLDIWVRKGIPGVPLPIIMGSDGAGVVVKIGDDVSNFRKGDSVLIQPLTYCGKCRWCQCGKENYCEHWGILGENQNGTQCEYVAIDDNHLRKMLDGMSFEEAAAFPLVAETTYTMLIERAKIRRGETVFVWGASSGVGSMAIQIAKAMECQVISTGGTDGKVNFAKNIGADVAITYKDSDVYQLVKETTNGQGVDVVVEHVGAKTWKTSLRMLAKGGRLVTCGATTGSEGKVDIRHLFYKQQSILGSTMGAVSSLDKSIELYKQGKIKSVVDRVFKLEDIRQAHEYLENGNQIGKILVIPKY